MSPYLMKRVMGVWALACVLTVTGCRGPTDGYQGERGQVSGTVTLDGKPLAKGCQVIFLSKTGGYTASGVVNDSGAYTLSYVHGLSLPAIEYRVQLTAPVQPDSTETVDPSAMGAKLALKRKGGAASDSPFPVKYGSAEKSGLEFKVAAGSNTADFKLESDKK
jgi:hypothetical protein